MKYTHGGNAFLYGGEILDFSANINPLGTPEPVREAAARAAARADTYPDYMCTELREAIAAREGVPAGYIICGNGAAELIYSAMYAIRPTRCVIHNPTFSEYGAAARAARGTTEKEVEFICNPNNPTGLLMPKDDIKSRANENDRVMFIDECFMDFVTGYEKYSCVDLIEDYKNLIVLKSFTKMYAIPGLRLGYLMTSNTDLLEKIHAVRQPWSVSTVAQAAGIAAARDLHTPEFMREYIASARKTLETEFDRLGIEYIKSAANFIMFKSEPGLKEALLKYGILIRDCSDFTGAGIGDYRIAVRTGGENRRLIKALEAVLWQNR